MILVNAPVNFEFECKVFKANVQGALLAGLCACAAQHENFSQGMNFAIGTGPEQIRNVDSLH